MFVSTIFPAEPVWTHDEENRRYYVDYRIATCAETDRDLYLSCVLIEAWKDGVFFHEFKFEIALITNDESEHPYRMMERDLVSRYLPSDARPRVMGLVASGRSILISTVRPDRIFRVTKQRNLPDKALA